LTLAAGLEEVEDTPVVSTRALAGLLDTLTILLERPLGGVRASPENRRQLTPLPDSGTQLDQIAASCAIRRRR